jgi:TonB family protein
MFDKLVESDTTGAEFKNRSRYFMVSSVVVGILFLTAVVYSLYAAEMGIGSGNFDIAEMLAPVDSGTPEDLPQSERTSGEQTQSDRPVRRVLMEVTSTSTRVPIGVSAERNPFRTISADRFRDVKIGSGESDGHGRSFEGRTCNSNCTGSSSSNISDETETSYTKEPPPPAVKAKATVLRTSKVLNGEAISLPKPSFPQPAIALGLQGSVRVQVTIDETGDVISAKAADGHPFFRQAAEQAARNARFKPTYLNDNAVKVTGVIVYNFKRN